MVNNNNNTPDENNQPDDLNNQDANQNKESAEKNQNKIVDTFDYKKVINDFVQKNYESWWKIMDFELYNLLKSNRTDFDWIYNDFLLYVKKEWFDKSVLDKYTANEDLIFSDILKKKILKENIDIDNALNSAKKSISSEFNITNEQILDEKLNSLSINELNKLSFWDSYYKEKFLKKNKSIWASSIQKDEVLEKIFDWADFSDYLENSDVSKNEEIIDSLFKFFHQRSSLVYSDIENILSSFNQDWKIILVKYFIPEISFKELKELSFFNKNQFDEKLKEVLVANHNLDPNDEILRELIKEVNLENITLSTSDLSDANLLDLLGNDETIYKLMNEFNTEKLENIKNEILSFDDFLNKISKTDLLPKEKELIKKLELWWVIKFTKNSSNEEEKSISSFYYIDWLKTNVNLYNITKDNWVFDRYIDWTNLTITYNKLFDILISTWLDESFYVYTQDEFEKLKNQQETKDDGTKKDKSEEIKIFKNSNDIQTEDEFLNQLNQIDPSGKELSLKDTAFSLKVWDETDYYYIEKINWNSITLSNWETHSFSNFISILRQEEWFVKNWEEVSGFKRFKKINSSDDFINKVKDEFPFFNNLIIKDWKLIPKSKENDKDYNWSIEYLISSNSKESLQFKWFDNFSLSVRSWEFKESKNDKEKSTYKIEKTNTNMWYFEFYRYIKWLKDFEKYVPKETWEDKEVNEEFKNFNRKKHFITSYLSLWSAKEVWMWFKHAITAIEDYLKTGNTLKAAKFWNFFGKVLPKEIRSKLQAKLEKEEKSTMESLVSELSQKNTAEMIDAVCDILSNSSNEQYKIEAALMTIIWKFWTLYPKWLSNKRWSYIWYRALWGVPGDALYNKVKKECEEQALLNAWNAKFQPVAFTEELLVEKLLALQVKPESEYYPKRRNKFDKDYWKNVWKWISEELDDWNKKTADMVTFAWRYEYVLWELVNGTYANWVWWLKNVWWKAWNSHEVNAIPFIMTYTWMAKNFPQPLLKQLTSGEMWRNTPYTTLMFNKEPWKIELYKKAVLEVVKSFKNDKMLKDFNAIWDDVKKASSFWFWEFWSMLESRLMFRDWELYSIINWNNPNNVDQNIISDYYNFIKWMQTDWEFSMNDSFIKEWKTSPKDWIPVMLTWWRKLAKWKLALTHSGDMDNIWLKLVSEIIEILSSRRKEYQKEKDEDKKKLILEKYRSEFNELFTLLHWPLHKNSETFARFKKTSIYKSLKDEFINVDCFNPANHSKFTWWDSDAYFGYTKSTEYKWALKNICDSYFKSKNLDEKWAIEDDTRQKVNWILEQKNDDSKKQKNTQKR